MLAHFSGMLANEQTQNSPQMDDALAAAFEQQMRDPLSAAIQQAQEEDAANYRARQDRLAQELALLEQAAMPPFSDL